MKPILEELFSQYSNFIPDPYATQIIEEAHQQLIRSLEKPERKLVLRIIDNKDLIARARARESFECGFWLAWRLLAQLNIYDNGRLLEKNLGAGGRFCISHEHEKEEE